METEIFGPCDDLSASLERPDTSVGGALRAVDALAIKVTRQRLEH